MKKTIILLSSLFLLITNLSCGSSGSGGSAENNTEETHGLSIITNDIRCTYNGYPIESSCRKDTYDAPLLTVEYPIELGEAPVFNSPCKIQIKTISKEINIEPFEENEDYYISKNEWNVTRAHDIKINYFDIDINLENYTPVHSDDISDEYSVPVKFSCTNDNNTNYIINFQQLIFIDKIL